MTRSARRFLRSTALAGLCLFGAGCASQPARVPDLGDAHVHLSLYGERALAQLADGGVTFVRDCGGDLDQLRGWQREIAEGRRAGPQIYLAGPLIDGPKEGAPYRLVVTTPEEARRAIDSLADQRVDFIKTHNGLSRDTYFAVLAQAKARKLRVASHLPKGIPAWEAAEAGAGSIEHAAESLLASPIYAGEAATVDEAMQWWDSPRGDAAIARLAATKVAITPTLIRYAGDSERHRGTPLFEPRQRVLEFLIRLTGRLHRAGIPLLAGSDFPDTSSALVPGKSLLDELDLLQRAGLSRDAALDAAGKNLREWLAPVR